MTLSFEICQVTAFKKSFKKTMFWRLIKGGGEIENDSNTKGVGRERIFLKNTLSQARDIS